MPAFIINNPWSGYMTRSFQAIKNSIINRISISVPEITDLSESNPLIIIISMFAGLLETLHYYVDNMAREAYIGTARKYVSIIRLVKILDYRIKAAFAATADVIFTLDDGNGNIITATVNIFIPAGTIARTANNVQFLSTQNYFIYPGQSQVIIPMQQYTGVSNYILGTSSGLANQEIGLGINYVHNSISITINSVVWTEVASFAFSTPSSKHFIVDIKEDGQAYMFFGDGVFGSIPPANQNIVGSFKVTIGGAANDLLNNSIVNLISVITLPTGQRLTITNPAEPAGGSDYESFSKIKFRAPLWVRTLERAVSYQDYSDVAVLHPSVAKALVDFCCKFDCVRVYIGPEGGGIASQATINIVQQWMNCKKEVDTKVCVRRAGITHVKVELAITPVFRQDPVLVQSDALAAVLNYGSYNNQQINSDIRLSDLLSTVDNLPRVDFVNVTDIRTEPYAAAQNHYVELNWIRETLNSSTIRIKWRLVYSGGTHFRLWKGSVFMGTLTIGVPWTDPGNVINLTILTSPYTAGMEWNFVTYPINQDIDLDDFTIPVIELNDVILNVAIITDNACKPACH